MSKDEIKQAKKKPLVLRNKVSVYLLDKKNADELFPRPFGERVRERGLQQERSNPESGALENPAVYTFTIPSGFDYDGASISRFLWRLIGSKESIEFKVAALIHDVLCENHHYVNNDRYFADKVFEKLLKSGDVSNLKSRIMFHSVDNYQKIAGKWS